MERPLSRQQCGVTAVRRGAQRTVWASSRSGDEPDAGIIAYERSGGDAEGSYALVVINSHKQHASSPSFQGAPMKVSADPGTVLVDALSESGQSYTVGPDGTLQITLPPQTGALLLPSGS